MHTRDTIDDRERDLLVVRKRLEGREYETRLPRFEPFASAAKRECQRDAALAAAVRQQRRRLRECPRMTPERYRDESVL